MMTLTAQGTSRPPQLIAGIAMIAIAWPVAWFGVALVSRVTFLPLWLGYILAADGLLLVRTGTSPLARSRSAFLLRFVVSIPLWWIFEVCNARLGNWHYVLPVDYGFLRYHIEASLAFSTVLPALAVSAELWGASGWLKRRTRGPRFAPGLVARRGIAVAGGVMLAASLIWPATFFPLVWLGLFLFLDPINRELGARNLNEEVATGKWSTVYAWMLAGITCGIFWEMWNWQSIPKWVYTVPYADWLHVFEMPLLGYGGYLSFALECFAFLALAERFLPAKWHINVLSQTHHTS